MKRKDWIKRLPPGTYTIEELLKFSGLGKKSHGAIKQRLLKYGAKITQIPAEKGNTMKNIFTWEGYKSEIEEQDS